MSPDARILMNKLELMLKQSWTSTLVTMFLPGDPGWESMTASRKEGKIEMAIQSFLKSNQSVCSWVYRSDKMPVKFTNWGTNEPHGQPGSDQHTGQDCGYLVAAGNNDQGQGMWGDYICHSKQYQMCEMPAN